MSFDQNVYAALAANPAAQQAYLASFSAPAAAPAAAPIAQAQPQGYSNPAAVQPQPTLARGTLEDFYNQPSGNGGGPAVTSKFFNKRAQGSWLQLKVISDVTNADVRQQTTPQGIPQTFKDGRPKFVLVVKVQVLGSSDGTHTVEFPEGMGTLWVKGVLADELRRAMAAAGDSSGYPKAGADIVMVSAGEQASRTPGFSATKLYQLQYAPATGSVHSQEQLQAIAQASSGLPVDPTQNGATAPAPGLAPVTSAAPATAAPVAAPTLSPAPVSDGVSAVVTPSPAPFLTTPTAPAAAPVSAPAFIPAPPVISEGKDALLAKLNGNG